MRFKLSNKRFILSKKVKSWNGEYVNDLENISVELLSYPSHKQLLKYIPELVTATWNNDINEFRKSISRHDKCEIMKLFYSGKLIPTAMKSCQITILVKGITSHDVTHILRQSGLSFAADCTGDKYIENRPIIIPSFFEDMPKEYKDKYIELMKDSHKLYDDICNNFGEKVHIQDARLVLPRTLETFYYITGNLSDFIKFIKQRRDLQVQPKSDNILALRIYEQLIKVYPLHLNLNSKNEFYCSESEHQLSSKWYKPLPQNKTQYTCSMDTVYGEMNQMYGFKNYFMLDEKIKSHIKSMEKKK